MLLDLAFGDLRAVYARSEEPGRLQGEMVVRSELVARDLPFHEGVIRQVLVERLDHGIAIVVGAGPVVILLEAVAFTEASQIKPVAGPAFAELRGCE